MKLTSLFFTTSIIIFAAVPVLAQEKWDLKKSVEYALAHNISIRQQDVQARYAALTTKQGKLSQYPTANFSGNLALSSGRNQDPTTFSLITTSYLSSGYNLQAGFNLFNWFSQKNNIAGYQLDEKAANAQVDKLKNDLALNVANAYLNVLLTNEQANIAALQLKLSQSQLENTRKLVNAGSLPELSASDLESQVAKDSANYISARATVELNVLLMKAFMNVDPAVPFEVDTPPVEKIPVEAIGNLQPDMVYQLALANLPQQKVNKLRLEAAQKYVLGAKGAMYPTVSIFGNLGASFNNKAQEVTSSSTFIAPVGKVTVGGTDYNVFPNQPFTNFSYGKIGYFDQLSQNFRQTVGLSLNVPILGGGQLRTQYERSKLSVKNLELQQEQDNFTLKQNIYQAYTAAVAALQKFEANKITVANTQKSFDFANKRYNIGLLNTIDLIITQNNYFTAQLNLVYSQFDYVFKMKVLEFYKGQGLKL
ncbi:MAG: TolC family protein [Chitinophagaceae bacterium]